MTPALAAIGIMNMLLHLGAMLFGTGLLLKVCVSKSIISRFSFIYIDSLSAYFIFVISIVNFAGALYSIGYIRREMETGAISRRKAGLYYLSFNLFAFSMMSVPMVNNLGMLWVAIEMTTLISAFLVGFYNTKQSIEAAWKYIIICSAGIIFALLGTILLSYAYSAAGGIKSLNWTDIMSRAELLDKNILKIVFIFILIGYGTKAGIAPMHTWLPDAHSQAVAPASALLSGVLLKTAVYAILRFGIIVSRCLGWGFFSHLMVIFGLISLAVSAVFILVQKDIKRLLAYSSIEHIGIISIGFGLGTIPAVFGALFHIFNHAVTKSLMFFGAGNIVSTYKKHNMNGIRGVMKVMPFTGIMLLLGAFALTGFPPFSVFFSEFMIIIAAFTKGSYITGGLLLLFIVVIFGAIISHFGKLLFGHLPKGMKPEGERLSGKIVFIFLLLQITIFGIFMPAFLKNSIIAVAQSYWAPASPVTPGARSFNVR